MKKIVVMLLAFLFLFAGCKTKKNDDTDKNDTNNNIPEPTQQSPQQTPEASIMDSRVQAGSEKNVWILANDTVESMSQSQMQLFSDELLMSCVAADEEKCSTILTLVSLSSGEKTAQREITSSGCVTVQTGDSLIGVCDSASGWVQILDKNLDTVKTYEYPQNGENWYLSGNMDTLYIVSYSDGVEAVELDSGERTAVLPDAADAIVCGASNEYVIISYVDMGAKKNVSCCLELLTGEITDLPADGTVSYASRDDGMWLLQDGNNYGMYTFYEKGQTKEVNVGESQMILLPQKKLMVISGGRDLSMYDTDGTYISGCALQPGEYNSVGHDFLWSGQWNGYFFLDRTEYGDRLMFWDVSVKADGEPLIFADENDSETFEHLADEELYIRAGQMSEKYGMDIRIAEQCSDDYAGFTAYIVTDTSQITDALDVLERAFDRYPDGFFEQLEYGSIKKLAVELVGGITPKTDNTEVNGAAAFAHVQAEQMLISIDVNTIIELYVYHEISHLIDSFLEWDAYLRDDALYSDEGWMELQPVGFEYAYSYVSIPESVKQYYTSGYFVSDYACTYPTEDRATLMADAMTEQTDMFDANPQLKEKLDYYSRCIRDCFNTDGWPEVTAWEQVLY